MTTVMRNLVRVATATTGTGTIALGPGISGALSFAQAGVPDGATVSYAISDGAQSEAGRGVYDATAGTLTRGPLASTAANAAINLSGSAQVFLTALAEDFADRATAAQGALADSAVQPADLAAVATTGAYADLSGLPALGTAAATDATDYATAAQGALADSAVQPADLAAVATTGAYADLSGTPTLGTAAATDAADYATAAQGALAGSAVQPADLAAVATTGAYADLSGTPALGTAAATDATDYATAAQGALADSAVQPADLATVATTGAYADLTGLPALGTAAAEDAAAFAAAVHSHVLADIADAGTAAATDAADYATAAQGALADSAVQPADLVAAARVIWVDPAGDDAAAGDLPTAPKATVTAALAAAAPGDCIRIRAGLYIEAAPMIAPRDVSLVGDGLRVTEIRPTPATAGQPLFLVDSGCHFWGLTFARHQAGSWAVAFNAAADNTGIGASGPGAYILKSPYIQNCSSYTAQDDAGLAGSTSDGTTGGGMLVDGAACAPNSPIRSMVVDSYTQVNLDGPGCLVTNDGYAQLVSFFGTFCSYHVKALAGGQVNLSNSTTNFGTFGLVADGRSATPLFSGTGAAAADGANQIDVTGLGANRLGGSSRPALGQVFDVAGIQRTVTGASPVSGGWRVTFYPALTAAFAGGAIGFFQRSQIMTGGQNMEFVGAGTNYLALPWNGGVPIQANEIVELNGGRVFYSTTDHLGTFRVGPQFSVDGTTGEVTINTDSFNVSGLNQIGPFSRDGGQTTVGVQLREVSNDPGLIASTGAADGNTAPTQAAVVAYAAAKARAITAGAGLAGGGDLSADRTLSLDAASLASLALADSATQPGDLATVATTGAYADLTGKPTLGTAAATDATDYATAAQGALADSATQPGDLAAVATTGAYADLSGLPTLGTAAATDATDYATAAQGALADSATQPGDLATVATTGAYADLTGTPTLGTAAATDATDYATAAQGALADSATQPGDLATVATTGAYADLTGKPTLGTAAATDATDYATAAQGALADSATQPGDLAAVATTGAYADLTGTPTLGTAAAQDVGTGAGDVVQLDGAGKLPAVDGSQLTNIAAATGVGDVAGPASAAADAVALFDGTSGKLIKAGGALGSAAFTAATDYATAAEGALAASATQPGDLATVATTGAYADLTGTPTLGTAAAAATTDFATAAQGALADSAVQPGDLATVATTGAYADLSGLPALPANANDLATEGAALGDISGAATVDCAAGQVFTATVTGAATLTFANPETYDEIVLHLTNGGAAAVTWPASVDWPGGSAPTLTAAGVDVLVFVTADGGVTWRGALAAEDVK